MHRDVVAALVIVAFVLGLAFGLVGGLLRWHTGAEQRDQWHKYADEAVYVRDQCLASMSWQAQNLCRCPEPTPPPEPRAARLH